MVRKRRTTVVIAPRPRSGASKAKKKAAVKSSDVTSLGKALRALGTAGGSALGTYVGVPPTIGGVVGNSLGAAVSRWLGQGDYTVGTNSIVSSSLKAASSVPSMHKDGQSIIVRHREYLGEVTGSSTGFVVRQSYVLNPGNPVTFPWLSDIAAKFQEYRIRGAVFHYVPTSGSVASTSPALGSVMLQTSYRSTDSAPSSKVEMLNEYCSNEVVPSEVMAHPIECDPKENPFNVQYVRSGNVPVTDTQLMYDLGVTHLAVSGQQTAAVIGDLWISYDIELKKPIVNSNATFSTRAAYTQVLISTTTNLFGGTAVMAGNWDCKVNGNNLTFPKGSVGTWQVTVWFSPSTSFTAWGLLSGPTTTNCSTVTPYVGMSPQTPSGTGGEAYSLTRTFFISIVDPAVSALVSFPAWSITGTIGATNLLVTQISD